MQEGKRIILEPKAVSSKFRFSATIRCRIAKNLFFISKDAWKKYESAVQTDDENLNEIHCVISKVVTSKVLHSLKVNKAAEGNKIPARLVRDAETELAPSITSLINKSITEVAGMLFVCYFSIYPRHLTL